MPITLFVANLPYQADEGDIRGLFNLAGYIPSRVKVCKDGMRSKGYAHVDIADRDVGLAAIEDLDTQEFMGRRIAVCESKKEARTAARSRR